MEIVYRGAFRIRSFLKTIKTKKTVLISGEGTANFLRGGFYNQIEKFCYKNSIIEVQIISMFGGFGSINHMIVPLRNNKNLLPAKRSLFKNRDYSTIKNEYFNTVGDAFNIKKATPKQLLAIRKEIIKKRKNEARRSILLLGIGIPLIVLGLYFTFHNFRFGFPNVKTTQEISLENDDEEKYYFYLEDGDKWLQKRNYYNAVFQYKKAVALYPSDFEANYRLALGYSYQCQYDFENCDKGMQLILKLEKEFPDNKNIQDVKAIFVHWGE